MDMEAAWHVLNPKQPLMLSSMPCDMPPTMLQLACIQRLHARPVHRTTVPPVTWQRAIMPSMRIADALDGNKAACGRGFWRAGLLLKVLTHQGSAIDVSPVPCRAPARKATWMRHAPPGRRQRLFRLYRSLLILNDRAVCEDCN